MLKKYFNSASVNISNGFSLLRLVLAFPIFFLLLKINTWSNLQYYAAILIIFVAVISDYLDGYYARKRNEITELGKIIDPLADKVGIIGYVMGLYLVDKIPNYLFFMIIFRDLLIFLGGIFVTKKIGKVLPSNLLGKITVNILALYLLIRTFFANVNTFFLEVLSVIFIIMSLFFYILRAYEYVKNYEEMNR